jgi:LuxR family maltose regulon positive regulatory protein
LRARDSAAGGVPPPPAIDAYRRAIETHLSIAAGDLAGAQTLLDAARSDDPELHSARVRLAVECRDLEGARAVLGRWPERRDPRDKIERLIWLAVVGQLGGDDTRARTFLADAVALADVERNIGVFRLAGRHVLAPARSLYRVHPTAFVRAIVEDPSIAVSLRARPAPELVEQLTDREFMVLALLPKRLSNVEIAQQLEISLNTTKTHLKHIYRKLGVTHRAEAVAAAERMRLL